MKGVCDEDTSINEGKMNKKVNLPLGQLKNITRHYNVIMLAGNKIAMGPTRNARRTYSCLSSISHQSVGRAISQPPIMQLKINSESHSL